MNSKFLIFLGMFIGSSLGGYLPVLFGGDMISYISVLTSGIGAIIGIFIGYKLSSG
ncbi:MAG: hypothetical protein PHQ59_02125 [Candidatus Daviesbacteria bacterium]|nr:hypothetical protein [Candidatus Daviesbacteria bacterium]